MMEKRKSDSFEALSTAIGFTEKELNANRDGFITRRQRIRLSDKRAMWTYGMVLGLFLCPAVSYLSTQDGVFNTGHVCFTWFLVIGGVFMVLYCWQRREGFNGDVHTGHVASAKGRVCVYSFGEGKRVAYGLDILDVHFSLNKHTFLAFKNGDPYAIYYAPHSQTLLSAEWLWE